jgi:hypothetical protein
MQPLNVSSDDIRGKMSNPSILDDIQEWDFVTLSYFSQLKPLQLPEILTPSITNDKPLFEFNLLRTWHHNKKHPFTFVW